MPAIKSSLFSEIPTRKPDMALIQASIQSHMAALRDTDSRSSGPLTIEDSGTYNASPGEIVICKGPMTVRLPAATSDITRSVITVKFRALSGSLTVLPVGGDTIDGEDAVDILPDDCLTIMCVSSHEWVLL